MHCLFPACGHGLPGSLGKALESRSRWQALSPRAAQGWCHAGCANGSSPFGPRGQVQWVALGSCRSTPPQTPYKYYIRSKRGLLRQSIHHGQHCMANGHIAAVGVDVGRCRSRLGVAKYFVQTMREREAICTSAPCRSRFCRLSEWTVHSDSRHIRGRNA